MTEDLELYLVVAFLVLLPGSILATNWWLWRRAADQSEPKWRRHILLAELVSTSLSLGVLLAEWFYEANIGPRNWGFFGWLGDTALALFLLSIVGAVLGKGGGRLLLAVSALLVLALWFLVTGPVWP